ncbi:DNA-binding transcriptional LysR family regulator [Novosphingobium sp. SG751A]|nr:DNA-binding transcriptional LysR family regulator [Novosphingobium sp. SG751A]
MTNESIDVAGIEKEEMVLLNRTFATRQTIDRHFKRHGIKPNVVIETSSMTTLIELVRSSSLVTILPDAVAFERDDLRFRPLLPAIDERRVVLLQREGGYRSAAARAFIATLELFVQELNAASLT